MIQYFEGTLKNTKLEKKTLSARLRYVLNKFNEEAPWPSIPNGPLISIADGLMESFNGKMYVVCFIMVRSISSSEAIILPPYMCEGRETSKGWQEAFAQVPNEVFNRIEALVCDGHCGMTSIAKRNDWVLQRYHFHILASISHFTSFKRGTKKNIELGIRIKRLAQVVIYQHDQEAVNLAINALKIIKQDIKSIRFKTVISGFIKYHENFRAYLKYPQYNLPTTSNCAEFLNSRIRDLQYRAKGFRTP
ncbi:MAG: transposase [Desulfuromonadales bacterium]|nr:transposase [Desulfuromonadales bacterium]